jgi:hypothetical protein
MNGEVGSQELVKQSPGLPSVAASHGAWSTIRALGLACGATVACKWGLLPGEALAFIYIALAAPNQSLEDFGRKVLTRYLGSGGANRQQ